MYSWLFESCAFGLFWVPDVGVLLCRGNRLLTGSNTRWLRLWEVEAVRGVQPQGKVCSVEERSATRCAIIAVLVLCSAIDPFNYVACPYHESIYSVETAAHLSASFQFLKKGNHFVNNEKAQGRFLLLKNTRHVCSLSDIFPVNM